MGDGEVTRIQRVDLAPAENYRGTFAPGLPELSLGDPLPPGWEGLYFPFSSTMDGLRPDGTPSDDVLPEIDLPRRMYAGEDTVFHRPIRLGDTVEQRVRAGRVTEKSGRNGKLVFADIERRYFVDGEPAVESTWHDVFLEEGAPPAPPREVEEVGERSYRHTPDSRRLFRFSAITFNTHRVHYDRDWAQREEGLADLLVHGPLTRLLMLDAAMGHDGDGRGHERTPARYSFTATAPLFVDREITVGVTDGKDEARVVAVDDHGHLAAKATVHW
ncbi:MaoC family dehydratase N-terminal domain-containing protein [Nocardiopsis sp. JB363]|uniref:FAS1-like dehydratase domain-containing protein n=1 Tax=Nocardiopsis sp. JB363 TaxID=1434837 RepID=UPI00097B0E49|nr:MaoC family dehydratase N-terminal domain-containing protein [Nocardiopsis sp. JB363]SIO88762.1 COGs COG3777 [Nocardiopsis sp. JB363]